MIGLHSIGLNRKRRSKPRDAGPEAIRYRSSRIGQSNESLESTAERQQSQVALPRRTPGHSSLSAHISFNSEDLQQHIEARLSHVETGSSSEQSLDDYIRERGASGECCPHQMCTRHWSGVAMWQLDSTNIEIARAAVETLDLIDEPGARWLSGPPNQWLGELRYLCGDRWILDANQLALTRRLGIIDKLPRITEDEINDLNKGDVVVKLLAVSQISWLCVQLITRLSQNMPITQLELVTLSFAVCSIVTYGLFYNRPKDVQTIRETLAVRNPNPVEMARIASMGPEYWLIPRQNASMPNNTIHMTSGPHFFFGSMFALAVFGGLHLLAWNQEFPTQAERRLWQASALVTIAVMPLALLMLWPPFLPTVLARINQTKYEALLAYVCLAPFFAARTFVLVEAVRSLAFQPPETFRTTWAANVPHVG
jgi:hypothetical protein